MYNVLYCLVDGNTVIVEVKEDEFSEGNVEQFILETRNNIMTGGVVQTETRTPNGYPKTTIINTRNITKVECINLDDKVTENN